MVVLLPHLVVFPLVNVFLDSTGENADRDGEKKSLERVTGLCFLTSCMQWRTFSPLVFSSSHLGHAQDIILVFGKGYA